MLAELYCFRLVRPSVYGHSNSVIFNQISSKFYIWIASINLSVKFEYGFCPTSDNKDGRQNGRHLSIAAVVVTLTQSFLIGFLPNFIYGLLPSNSCSSLNISLVRRTITKMAAKMAAYYQFAFCLSDNQDGRQNGHQLSVYTFGHSNLVIYHPISSKCHIWTTFIKLLFMSEYGFCQMNDYQDFRQNGYPLFVAGH